MELFIIKWAACLGIFFLFYKLFLEGTSMHIFKRFYLLASLGASFLIPMITFTQYVTITEPIVPMFTSEVAAAMLQSSEIAVVETSYLPVILWSLYGLGVLFFSLKFARNLFHILQKIRRNPKYRERNIFHVLLNTPTTPHTFFSYIFLNKKKFEACEIPKEVLLHEQTHAREKHSIDVLFIEILHIVFWWNPFLYAIKHSIKLNHEFLADRAVLNQGIDTSTYQKILLAFSSTAGTPQLANSINYSSNRLNQLFSRIAFGQVKKRFTVMKTRTSKRAVWLRTLIILPLLALLIYSFSTTEVVEQKKEPFLDSNQNSFVTHSQEKATPKQIREYNKLAKKYNEMPKENMWIDGKEVTRMRYIYDLMTLEQRKNAEPYPSIPPPPPAPDAPNEFELADIPPPPPSPGGANEFELADIPPPPPPAPDAPNDFEEKDGTWPPPPAWPVSPLDHIIQMAKDGANFYYEGKKISSDKAINLLKTNGNLNIQTIPNRNGTPTVNISKKPIVIDNNKTMAMQIRSVPAYGPVPLNKEPVVDIEKMIAKDAEFYLGTKNISIKRVRQIIKSAETSYQIKTVVGTDGKTKVYFLDDGC